MTSPQSPRPPKKDPPSPAPPAASRPTLTPRPRVLIVAAVAFALWVAALVAMYFTTIYPNRARTDVVKQSSDR